MSKSEPTHHIDLGAPCDSCGEIWLVSELGTAMMFHQSDCAYFHKVEATPATQSPTQPATK